MSLSTIKKKLKRISSIFILFISYLSLTSFSFFDTPWQLKKCDSGIMVYTRVSDVSPFKELKAETNLKTSLSSIVGLLYDWEAYPEWVYKCGKSFTLKNISESELVHYQTVVAPWPVDSRDFVVIIKIEQNKTTKVVTIKSSGTGSYIPVITPYVRIMDFTASWTLTPKKDGTVDLVYQLLVDPGGYVPAWIVNLAIIDGPYETVLNMQKWIQKEKYQKTKIPFILELE